MMKRGVARKRIINPRTKKPWDDEGLINLDGIGWFYLIITGDYEKNVDRAIEIFKKMHPDFENAEYSIEEME